MHARDDAATPNGYILVQAQAGADPADVAALVMQIPGVTRAEPVRGPYDVIVEVRDDAGSPPAENAIRALGSVLRAVPLELAPTATEAA